MRTTSRSVGAGEVGGNALVMRMCNALTSSAENTSVAGESGLRQELEDVGLAVRQRMICTPAGVRSSVSLSEMSHFELSFSSIGVTCRRSIFS
jgi:hypothetical protein